MDFAEFERRSRAEGYDEVLERQWPAHAVVPEHIHPFALRARLVKGRMTLEVGGKLRRLKPGDEFSLTHDEPHAESYGPEGATYWVARRTARG